ncbi:MULTISPECIES: SulP family inorganic anion transporter [unclassified Microbacterium]|uniref:SulP family inorganic anion transporter n=1 Tax=unclassified Microbacterium TaxID=2609290 RepID=UPI0012F7156A|nr:SulP family inorganic anion transporter [Microbacterium sp. MAH-37]MVQ42483.1 STAS domain-containing protein [Microbacterium sp. MAH-37]
MSIGSGLRRWTARFGDRSTVGSDIRAGVVLGVESVPDGLAAGVLAGVSPLYGLYGYMLGTLGGALTTGSVFMAVQATGAMAVIIGDVPEVQGDDSAGAMAMLTLIAGVVMLGLGIARLGSLVRFIPSAVLIGFMNAVAINIVLGQLDNITGFESAGANRIMRFLDTLVSVPQFSWPTVLVGVVTIGLILLLERTPLGALALVVAVIAGSLLVLVLPGGSVATIGDIAEVTRSLPTPVLPDLSLFGALIVPGVSIALVGLVQGAAISGSIPNPDGRYPDASADFRGQGIANIVSGLLRGMPVGGSSSATALVRTAGAKTALANLVAGVVMIITLLAFGPLIEYIAMPALAGLLILVGVRTLKIHQVLLVWRTGTTQITVFLVTFLLTLLIPLQYAVLAGVGLSIVLHIARQSNRVRIVRWQFDDPGGHPLEVAPPAVVPHDEIVILSPYGSLFFASAQSFRAQLPTPTDDSAGATVIIRLRGSEELGVTFLTMVRDYAEELAAHDATLMLVGVGKRLQDQLDATGVGARIGGGNVIPVRPRVGDSLAEALAIVASRNDDSAR